MALRLHIVVAAAVVLAGGLVALLAFGDRKPRFVGTNSVGPTARVASVAPGQALCVRDLRLPAGAASVSMVLAGRDGSGTRVDLALHSARTTVRTSTRVAGRQLADAQFRIPPPRTAAPARLCLRPRGGGIVVAGTRTNPLEGTNYAPQGATVGVEPNAALNGRPIPGLVTVRFRAGEATTRLGALDEATRRASLFRPGWVGPWTFAALAALVPLLWAAGLAALWRAGR